MDDASAIRAARMRELFEHVGAEEFGKRRGWRCRIADATDLHPSYVSRILNGKLEAVGEEVATRVAERLGIDPAVFVSSDTLPARLLKDMGARARAASERDHVTAQTLALVAGMRSAWTKQVGRDHGWRSAAARTLGVSASLVSKWDTESGPITVGKFVRRAVVELPGCAGLFSREPLSAPEAERLGASLLRGAGELGEQRAIETQAGDGELQALRLLAQLDADAWSRVRAWADDYHASRRAKNADT